MTFDLSDVAVDLGDLLRLDPDRFIGWLKRPVSGTYRNVTPAGSGSILELRVDVDGRRPQERLSGDIYTHFTFCGIPITFFVGSFVVDTVTEAGDQSAISLSGPVRYYSNSNTSDSIEVHIPRVNYFASPAAACVEWFSSGNLVRSYVCPKISEYFRIGTLEVDRFQGTVFPPTLDPDIDPSPTGLPSSVSIGEVFRRAGIDLTVNHDDTLSDPDSGDVGDNWSEAELHDLMETRFDSFVNTLQWKLYGVVVPKFGDPTYNSGYYGTMFDWGGWQVGDARLRQGWAVAETAIRGRESGDLYDTSDEKDRLILQTMIHEAGHSFNLPHSWQRTVNADSGSESFMNYPWGYTDNGGGEENFWANFRWEFDDPELLWMRHADRNDVIFGGRDWIGNNLSIDHRPAFDGEQPAHLDISSANVFDLGVPVSLQLTLTNQSSQALRAVDRLQPEDGLLHVTIQRPDRQLVSYQPPALRLLSPPTATELKPNESRYASIGLSYGAKGPMFPEPGEYVITVFFPCFPLGFLTTASHRIRIAHPRTRESEELIHLLTSLEAAQFLYYGGTRRNPEVTERLEAAIDRYRDSDPVAVRHISAALGRAAARDHKHLRIKKGKQVITVLNADLERAADFLAKSVAPVADGGRKASAFDPITEIRLVNQLAASQVKLGHVSEATAVVTRTAKRLGQEGVPSTLVDDLKRPRVRNTKSR